MTGNYRFHPEAARDLDDIWDYIAQDSLDAADRVITEIFAALEMLAVSPYVGHSRPDLAARPLRIWPVRDFLIAYAPDEQPLWVIAVLHGRRNPRLLAAMLRRRR